MKRKGFTLIELLVVIAIIGLLSTLSVVSLNSARGKAKDAARKSDMNAIAKAMELYNVEEGGYPLSFPDCNNNILADRDDNIICSGWSIITTDGETILQSIPAPPETGDYLGFSNTTSYCISATLEPTSDGTNDVFKCVNGSCFLADTVCNSVSG
jgi:prepilin-type N-terminal cleavage/methylation domain-containing protein